MANTRRAACRALGALALCAGMGALTLAAPGAYAQDKQITLGFAQSRRRKRMAHGEHRVGEIRRH